jgi:hypothetical protein
MTPLQSDQRLRQRRVAGGTVALFTVANRELGSLEVNGPGAPMRVRVGPLIPIEFGNTRNIFIALSLFCLYEQDVGHDSDVEAFLVPFAGKCRGHNSRPVV